MSNCADTLHFASIAASMIETYENVDNLQLAPGGVVSKIYPLEGNEAAIGHDLLNDPARRAESMAAIEARELTLAGPFTLIQGGIAVIGRLPVFIPDDSGEDRFWGFTISLIRMDTLLDAAMLDRPAGRNRDFRLSRVHPDTGRSDTFFVSTDRDLSDEMRFAIGVPNGEWTLHLETNLGRGPLLLAAEAGSAILVAALLAIALYVYLSRIGDRKRAAEALQESEERFRQMAENVREVFFLVDHQNYDVMYANSAYEEIWGRTPESLYEQPTSWLEAVHQDDRERVYAALEVQQVTGNFAEEFRIVWPDGSVRWVHDEVYQIHDAAGKIYRLVGTALDITDRRLAEEELNASLNEKELLLREINHRVKNNLQIVSSLLNLQSRQLSDPDAQQMLKGSQSRIWSMALVHEKLYQSEDLARVNFAEYLRGLTAELDDSYHFSSRDIRVKIDAGNVVLGVDAAIPCGLIVNELVTNSLKHAYPADTGGEIRVVLQAEGNQNYLAVSDGGIGFPGDFNIGSSESLGLKLVEALASQLGGTLALSSDDGAGVVITFSQRQT